MRKDYTEQLALEFTWLNISWEGHGVQGMRVTDMKSRDVESEFFV